jgi:apolipoprotein N-acyltransferase
LVARFRALRGVALALVLFAAGGLAALAFAPFHVWPLLFPIFGVLAIALEGARPLRAFARGWVFAYGYFVFGLYWTAISFLVEPDRFAWLIPLPVLGLPALLAIFPALGISLAHVFPARGWANCLRLGLGWSLGEYARSHLFTGLPWNLVGQAWAFSDSLTQSVAFVGVQGLSLLTVALAALPAALATRETRRGNAAWLGAFIVLFAALDVSGQLRLQGADTAEVDGVRLRIVQANIAQSLKWREEERAVNLRRHLELSLAPSHERISHWIWPEAAVPYLLEADADLRVRVASLIPEGGALITGAPRLAREAGAIAIFNSVLAIDPNGDLRAVYDKRHLVPFGEYLPFRPYLARLGLDKLAPGAVDFSPGAGPLSFTVPGLPAARALVCYEGIFAEEIAPWGEARPFWLVNLTNDAWFGRSIGPYQHLAITRLRAIEQGLPLVRAANTGISAVIDPYGRIIDKLDLGQAGVIDAALPAALAEPPPYVYVGDLPFMVLFLVFFAAVLCQRRAPKIARA